MKKVKSTPDIHLTTKRPDILEWNKHSYARIAPVGSPNEHRFEMIDKPAAVMSQYSRTTYADFQSLQSRKRDLSPESQSPRKLC